MGDGLLKLLRLLGWEKIHNKFLITSLGIGIVPLVVLGSVSFAISNRDLIDEYQNLALTNLETSNSTVNILASNVERITRRFISSEVISGAMQGTDAASGHAPDTRTSQLLDREIKSFLLDIGVVYDVYLLSDNGFRYRCTEPSFWSEKVPDMQGFDMQRLQEQEWYRQTLAADGKECYFLHNVLAEETAGSVFISTTKLLRDLHTGEAYGVLVLNLHHRYYERVFPPAIKGSSHYLLANETGGRIAAVDFYEDRASHDEKLEQAALVLRGQRPDSRYIALSYRNRKTGYHIMHIIRRSDVRAMNFSIPIVTLIAVAGLVVVAIVISVLSARAITQPLYQLRDAIRDMNREEQIAKLRFGDDEVGAIGSSFQSMVKKNAELNRRIIDISLLQKEAELDALQAQINPHFLYNTLASMYWLAKFGKTDDVAQMAVDLSDVFRFALKRGDNLIAVEEELGHIRKYLHIQNYRYGGRIQVEENVAPELLKKRIMKLILQPLVENAIYHGLEPKQGPWSLKISGSIENGVMCFVIEDNGVGMDSDASIAHGFGINNVSSRIRLRYGEAYGCTFDSAIGRGTRATVRIPVDPDIAGTVD